MVVLTVTNPRAVHRFNHSFCLVYHHTSLAPRISLRPASDTNCNDTGCFGNNRRAVWILAIFRVSLFIFASTLVYYSDNKWFGMFGSSIANNRPTHDGNYDPDSTPNWISTLLWILIYTFIELMGPLTLNICVLIMSFVSDILVVYIWMLAISSAPLWFFLANVVVGSAVITYQGYPRIALICAIEQRIITQKTHPLEICGCFRRYDV